jgi:hypothetical protein
MDDEQYRQTRDAIDLPPCLYGKALQYGYFVCQHAQNISLGEREALHCQHQPSFANCQEYFDLALEKSGFALGVRSLPAHLTFNKAMQVQIGGLQGAMRLLDAPNPEVFSKNMQAGVDVADGFIRLKAKTPDFRKLNFSLIVAFIQQFSLRRRGRGKPP